MQRLSGSSRRNLRPDAFSIDMRINVDRPVWPKGTQPPVDVLNDTVIYTYGQSRHDVFLCENAQSLCEQREGHLADSGWHVLCLKHVVIKRRKGDI
jgi:hypothetical protein